MTDEESIFDAAEVSEVAPEDTNIDIEDDQDISTWTPKVSKESPKEKLARTGVKKAMDGKTLTIKEVGFTKPKMRNQDGTKIAPKKTQNEEHEYYPGKLSIKFEEENLVEYYPNFHYFVQTDGSVSEFAKINRKGDNAVSGIFKLVVAKLGKPVDEISDQDVYDYLVGKKVKISTKKGKYLGKEWFRNDILEIVTQ